MIWDKIINGKYQRWIQVINPIHFIFEYTENEFDIIITCGTDWEHNKKLQYKNGTEVKNG